MLKKKERKEVEEGGEKERRISSYLEDYCIAARHSSAPFRIFLAIIRVSDIGAAFSGRKRGERGEKGLTSGRNGLKKWEPRGGKWISTRRGSERASVVLDESNKFSET